MFTPLFQLLPIIGFVAPLLSKSHMVVYGQQHNSCSHSKNTGGIDLATYKEACGVSVREYTVVDSVFEQSLVNDSSANTAYMY